MAILGPDSVAGSMRIPATTLTEFSVQMFSAAGLSASDAATAAAVLINADLRGSRLVARHHPTPNVYTEASKQCRKGQT